MRKTYRVHKGNRQYWHDRWEAVGVDSGNLSMDHYPGKYAAPVVERCDGMVLESGCGSGRVLLHYARKGAPIVGMDFICSALGYIREEEPELPLACGDAMNLPFADNSFGAVLAFGLYHNLEEGVINALGETRRILKPGGLLCASFRADNIQTRFTDWLANRNAPKGTRQFHKANYTRSELLRYFRDAGYADARMETVENMPFLYKFKFFRHRTQNHFDEVVARGEGYRLSWLGKTIQSLFMLCLPTQFCNIFVVTCKKNTE